VDKIEYYYWLLKVDPKAGAAQSIMLSNDMYCSRQIKRKKVLA
jgi:hypothetical protein